LLLPAKDYFNFEIFTPKILFEIVMFSFCACLVPGFGRKKYVSDEKNGNRLSPDRCLYFILVVVSLLKFSFNFLFTQINWYKYHNASSNRYKKCINEAFSNY